MERGMHFPTRTRPCCHANVAAAITGNYRECLSSCYVYGRGWRQVSENPFIRLMALEWTYCG